MTSVFSWDDTSGADGASGAFLPGVGEDIDSDVGGSGGAGEFVVGDFAELDGAMVDGAP